ncbi:RNA polymerase II elongation factor ell1 [Elsinoe australis]|uniref:RNA polymerase II elongation factor ell1 n=1 Tax=Elsinoe australis TaxID=40998 RepID=A0A2P8AJI6_9PEZI|nr:RNA polymerase II elongation factor ell1 [Elsinoe australis]
MSDYETRRLEKIKRNQALLDDLGIARKELEKTKRPAPKKRKFTTSTPLQPTRASARIASTPSKPLYDEIERTSRSAKRQKTTNSAPSQPRKALASPPPTPKYELSALESNWYGWTPSAPAPTRTADGTFHFESHPTFLPNKSPLEMLTEGAFGGSYYRPLYSRTLGTTISDDWKRLPEEWLSQLNVEQQLTNSVYDPEVNKFGVKCGQSIEEWEANGWINAEWDVRGWFQWYERFFRGRRGDDDERQVGRWERCVGGRGRWRRALAKGFLRKGVKSVADEGDGDEEEVSPVLCQTCHHWAWEMRQEYLDEVWTVGR